MEYKKICCNENALPVFDIKRALISVNGKEVLLEKVLKMFLDGATERIQSLKASVADHDALSENKAHSLKGLARTIGAERIGELAWGIEQAVREKDFNTGNELLENIDFEFQALKKELEELDIKSILLKV
jgi:HPt (histidine-containing phosphotransfer) domain-containing protein